MFGRRPGRRPARPHGMSTA